MKKVKIKTWEQMEEELGLIEKGFIDAEFGFTEEMEELMPKDRIIEIDEDVFWAETGFYISNDMIEEVIEEEM